MGETIGKIIESMFDLLTKNYKRPGLWVTLGILFFCFVLLFPYIDSNFFYFSRIEKRIDVLEHVMELDAEKVNSNQAYIEEYNNILSEIEQQNDRTVNSPINKIIHFANRIINLDVDEGNKVVKFFTGTIWFVILTICIPFMKTFKKKSDKWIAFVMVIIFTLIVGFVSAIIPTIIHPVVNYVGIPLIQIIFLIFLLVKTSKKNEKTKES